MVGGMARMVLLGESMPTQTSGHDSPTDHGCIRHKMGWSTRNHEDRRLLNSTTVNMASQPKGDVPCSRCDPAPSSSFTKCTSASPDNRTVVSCNSKDGGTKSKKLLEQTRELIQILGKLNTHVVAQYFLGRFNAKMDALSRHKAQPK